MLTLICGLPRAGETTYAQRYKCEVLHYDDLGYQMIMQTVQRRLSDVVVEGIYHTAHQRAKLAEAYNNDGKVCIWIDTPEEIRKMRLMWVPNHIIFEPPTLEEGWDELIVIRGDTVERYFR